MPKLYHMVTALLLAFTFLYSPPLVGAADRPSVILIIGDGLGVNLQEAARLIDGPLAVDRMGSREMVRTESESDVITDSAAAATAMGTGNKTRNRSLGVDATGKLLPTLAEEAHRNGMGVGLVTTSFVFDATPMGFLVHTFDRSDTDAISKQVLEFKPEVLMGGGEADLLPAGMQGHFGPGHRKDGINLLAVFQNNGYHVTTEPAERLPMQLALLAADEMFTSEESPMRSLSPVTLPVMLNAALASLDPRKGFFLLAEEEQTDEAGHLNDVAGALRAVRYWNATVEAALRYRAKHPQTIVLVTSDHETGGFHIMKPAECKTQNPGTQLMNTRQGKPVCLKFTTGQHTASPVLIYASGISLPDRMLDNTEIHGLLRKGLALKPKRQTIQRALAEP